jgi:hypothetical protein
VETVDQFRRGVRHGVMNLVRLVNVEMWLRSLPPSPAVGQLKSA